ncbi:hypothetical protein [Pseudomonas syringae group sp. J309-1]|uniref:hypothetical protein n=1 Tax=Pseudomonas syringae group sp. J309-1 TaxID=3079588 RepID=UPI002909C548|nr:hypothetical protein [Pseudomonas syringae group sp. J309-1]MDU8358164.1 hypothetical protein [Pseudomonas syringae group sp. J309-1]
MDLSLSKKGWSALALTGLIYLAAGNSYAADGEAFSPSTACSVLARTPGFKPNPSGYSELYDGVYSCGTPYKYLGSQELPNNVALYGRGTADEVTRVKLMLNVNVASRAVADTKALAALCTKMIGDLAGTVPVGFGKKASLGKPFEEQFQGYKIFLTKEVWPTGKGFELNCGIAILSHEE